MEFLHITYGGMEPPLSELLPHGKCFAGLKVKPQALSSTAYPIDFSLQDVFEYISQY